MHQTLFYSDLNICVQFPVNYMLHANFEFKLHMKLKLYREPSYALKIKDI